MIDWILSGFRLQLFGHHELRMAYWYLNRLATQLLDALGGMLSPVTMLLVLS